MANTDTDLTDFIVRELGKHRRRSDITADVCERSGLAWAEAQRLVYQVAYEQRKQVAQRQSPLVLFLGFGLIAAGVFLAAAGVATLVGGISFPLNRVPYLGNLVAVGFGVVLIAGGVIGVWERIKTFLE